MRWDGMGWDQLETLGWGLVLSATEREHEVWRWDGRGSGVGK